MRVTSLFVFLLCYLTSNAQLFYSNIDFNVISSTNIPFAYTPKKDVKKVNFIIEGKNGKKKEYIKEYLPGNKLIKFLVKEDDKFIPNIEIKYNENGKIVESKSFKNGAIRSMNKYTRNSSDKILSLENYGKKEKLKSYTLRKYNNDECVSKVEYWKPNKSVAESEYVHSYFSPCKRSKSELFKRGRLVKTTTYDCKAEGDVLVKKKNTTQICKWEESDDNFLVKVFQSFDEKGRIRKYISKYTLADTLLVEQKVYDIENQLQSWTTYENSYKKPLHYKSFRNGKLKWEHIKSYEGDLVSEFEFKKDGKRRSKSVYLYEDELLIEFTKTNTKGDIVKHALLSYVPFN